MHHLSTIANRLMQRHASLEDVAVQTVYFDDDGQAHPGKPTSLAAFLHQMVLH
ncbi:hypothetical protein [Pseudoprimorskyibacter insulae]|uniref:Uncharacterized protein n=1 Tax=Pseudoprimorskyibacter insulae TaxID=1695997 RepID=A0A2R8AVL1_9RHOB|nr:hypothetical protein [Pseudoprimorskyibacter insulae]SPF80066.1 hypothetical protein PRI8871_01868 [Pseudoprimorskyibacter insulae]